MRENPPNPSPPHRKTGKPRGRPKGSPNKITAQARVAFTALWDDIGPDVAGWIKAAAQQDPAKGAQLAIAVAEYFVPRLARHETTINAGKEFAELVLAAQRIRQGKS